MLNPALPRSENEADTANPADCDVVHTPRIAKTPINYQKATQAYRQTDAEACRFDKPSDVDKAALMPVTKADELVVSPADVIGNTDNDIPSSTAHASDDRVDSSALTMPYGEPRPEGRWSFHDAHGSHKSHRFEKPFNDHKGPGAADFPYIPTRHKPQPHLDPWEEKRSREPKPAPNRELISVMRIRRRVLERINKTIGQYPAERGGMLLCSVGDYTITDYIFDASAVTSGAAYNPNTGFLNRELVGREEQFIGIVHSHPPGCCQLSGQDRRAAWSNLTSPGNPHLNAYLMPLVMTVPDTGKFELLPFIVTCAPHGNGDVVVRAVDLKIVD